MKKLFLLSVIVLAYGQLIAQQQPSGPSTHSTISDQFSKLVSVPNSPEAEAFSQYGEVDVSLHTGTPNISVPLYTIQGRELSLPISLTYNAGGIRVDQVATNVGLGWNLNVGGRISRQTRGLPDDYETSLSDYYSLKDITQVRSKILAYRNFNGFNFNDILHGSNLDENYAQLIDFTEFMRKVYKSEYDIEQDYFTLNILGVNETIWMDTATYEAKALNNPNLKVDIYRAGHPVSVMGGRVTDAHGNRYFFGTYRDDRPNAPDYPFDPTETDPIERVERRSTNDTRTNMTLTIKYRSSWMVNRIVSANGKDVYDFQYTTHTDFDSPEFSSTINGVKTHGWQQDGVGNYFYSEANLPFSDVHSISDVQSHFQQQFLSTIYHNGREVVRFTFGDRRDLKNGDGKAVTSFSVYEDYAQSATALEKVDFDQGYFGNDDPSNNQNHYNIRLKLDRVSFGTPTVKNFYEFDYNDPGGLIDRRSQGQDYMGYYNGQIGNPCLFQEMLNLPGTAQGTYNLDGGNRDVNENVSQKGMLTRMTYPTGGYTEFDFGNHHDGTRAYPGLRIESIKSYTDEGQLATRKDYQYTTAFEGNTSSLIENYSPIMHLEVPIQPDPLAVCGGDPPDNPKMLYRYASPPNMGTHPYITYSTVFEARYNDGAHEGYTQYDFYNNATNGWNNTTFSPPFEKNYFTVYEDGKLNSTKVFDQSGTELVSTTNTYTQNDTPELVYEDQTVVFNRDLMHQFSYYKINDMGNGDVTVFKEPFTCGNGTYIPDNVGCSAGGTECIIEATDFLPSLDLKRVYIFGHTGGLTQVVKTEHFNGQTLSTTTDNTYRDNGTYLLESTTTKIGANKYRRTEYTYPKDLASPSAAETLLIDANRISTPIVTQVKQVDGNDNLLRLLSTQRTDYKEWTEHDTDYLQPQFIKTEKGGNGSNLEERIQIISLDPYGNIREASLTDGASVTYIWGYKGRYPVAKIEGRTYGSLDGVLTDAVENATAANMTTALEDLRIHVNTTGGLMTSYTYTPMVGVDTVTDPRGYTHYYHYDEHHRLKYVKDADGNVLSENEYVYRTN